MIIFINKNSTKFCQITLCIKRFIHRRKVVPFFLSHGVYNVEMYVLSIRHDTIREASLTCARKLTQFSLIYRTEPKTKKWKKEELKRNNGYAQNYR